MSKLQVLFLFAMESSDKSTVEASSSESNISRKRTHSFTSDALFKSPGDPPKKQALEQASSTGEDGLSPKKKKELIDTEERLKMQ